MCIMDRRLCPHCDESVSVKTYKAHRRMYYDPTSDKWSHRRTLIREQTSVSDSDDLIDSPPQSVGAMKQIPSSPVYDPSQGMRRDTGYS